MIKSFVVKVKSVKWKEKGLRNLLNYLEDPKRHKTTKIIKLNKFKKNSFLKNTLLNVYEKEINKKGRKISSYATSYVFTLPKGIKPSKEQYIKLINSIIDYFAKELGIDRKSLESQIYINIHHQSNSHINVIVPKVLRVGNSLITFDLTKKKYLATSKAFWSAILLQHMDLDIEKHIPKSQNKIIKKGNIPQGLSKKIDKYFEEKEKKVEKELEILNKKRKEIKKMVEQLEKENQKKEQILKTFATLVRYSKNYLETLKEKEYYKALKKAKDLKKEKISTKLKEHIENIEKKIKSKKMGI